MPTPTKSSQVIAKMETLALNLLGKANEDDALLDTKLDVFEKMTKWVAVKNKLEDDGAGDINRFKERIGADTEERRYPPSRRPKGYTEPPAKQPRLAALRSRVSATGDGGADGGGGDPGDPPAAAAG